MDHFDNKNMKKTTVVVKIQQDKVLNWQKSAPYVYRNAIFACSKKN